MTDVRNQSYVEYSVSAIMITILFALLHRIKGMKQGTEKFNAEEIIQNIANLLELKL